MPLSISEAYLAGLTSTAILFGISCATYYFCAYALIGEAIARRSFSGLRAIMFFVSTLMWLVAGVGVGQMVKHMITAFVEYKGEGGSDAGFADIRDPMNYVHALTYPIQVGLGDSFLVYRMWIVYERRWIVIVFPIILLLGDIVSGFGITAAEISLRDTPQATATDPKVVPWITAFFALTMTLNILCTGFIIRRIMVVTKNSAKSQMMESPLQRVTRIILESGLIYTMTSFMVLVVTIARSTALYIVADSFIPITAICFHLIILRTEISRDDGSTQERSRSMPLRFMQRNGNPSVGAPVITVSRHVDGEPVDVPVHSQDSLWSPKKEDA